MYAIQYSTVSLQFTHIEKLYEPIENTGARQGKIDQPNHFPQLCSSKWFQLIEIERIVRLVPK